MTPDQLRRAADLLTARLRGPSPDQPPHEYILSHAIYALADAMRKIAEEDET